MSTPYQVPTDLNADFRRTVVIDSRELPWLPSPQAGVERRLLDRVGAEVARATSIVRYAPDSTFPSHTHGAGEEFLVLDGVFSDEHGDYPEGSYVRNPPGSSHAPFTRKGCTIFVKLRQMQPQGEPQVVLLPSQISWQTMGSVERAKLYDSATEQVCFEHVTRDQLLPLHEPTSFELLILSGNISNGDETLGRGAWLRSPLPQRWRAVTDCRYWIKRGHLDSPIDA